MYIRTASKRTKAGLAGGDEVFAFNSFLLLQVQRVFLEGEPSLLKPPTVIAIPMMSLHDPLCRSADLRRIA